MDTIGNLFVLGIIVIIILSALGFGASGDKKKKRSSTESRKNASIHFENDDSFGSTSIDGGGGND